MIIQCEVEETYSDSSWYYCDYCKKQIDIDYYYYKIIENDKCDCKKCVEVNYFLDINSYEQFCSYKCAKKFIRKQAFNNFKSLMKHTENIFKYTNKHEFK